MGKVSQTIKGYLWWTYPRGSVHYDVMVTVILAFIFLAPLWINFRDKPQERPPRQTEWWCSRRTMASSTRWMRRR